MKRLELKTNDENVAKFILYLRREMKILSLGGFFYK
jgi:hypothetical protein